MTQSNGMPRLKPGMAAVLAISLAGIAQPQPSHLLSTSNAKQARPSHRPPPETEALPIEIEEDFRVYAEHPRLFLRPQRLRLLRREKERQSARWQQFELLVSGKAQTPEKGFSLALFYQVTGEPQYGRQAVEWAMRPSNDLRQLALVYDWCQPLLSESQSRALAAKLERAIAETGRTSSISAMRDRVLAAIAVGERFSELSEQQLRFSVQQWWRGQMVPALKSGRATAPREETYALLEILHAVRDNLRLDLREAVPRFFKELPVYQLLSYYPGAFPAAENEYWIPASKDAGEPDLRRAALSRAAELSMVAYDTNAQESQFLQGWLMRDRFLLSGPFGIPYEFLWANPYQPGLSYYHVPLVFHDQLFGRLFLRSSWEEDATWLGYFDGELQICEKGVPKILKPQTRPAPIQIGDALVILGRNQLRFRIDQPDISVVFVVGLNPRQRYEIEADNEKMREERTDSGGILTLPVSSKPGTRVRIRQAGTP